MTRGSVLYLFMWVILFPTNSFGQAAEVFKLLRCTPLPDATQMHGSAVVGDRLYVMGGENSGGWTNKVLSARISPDGAPAEWRTETPLPELRQYIMNSVEVAFTRSAQTGERILKRDEESGRCVFHNAERKCALHSAFGPTVKPIPCRAFPFRYCDTPGGVYVGLSFVCPTVRENVGDALLDQIPRLEQGYAFSQVRKNAPEIILLHENLAVSWEEYLEIERDFQALLAVRQLPLAKRLVALNVLINFIKSYEENIHGPHTPFAPPHHFYGNELGEFLDTIRRTGYADILRVAGRSRPSPRIQRMFLGMLMSFANNLWQKRGRFHVLAGITGQYIRHAAGLGGIRLNPLKTRVSHKMLGKTGFPEDEPAAELIERFLRHCIFRKDLLIAPNVLRGVNLLLLNAALIRWYATAVCAERGCSGLELHDFSEGIRHVEMLYGFHSKFYRFFQDQPMVEEVVDSFTRRKNYPFIIMGNG